MQPICPSPPPPFCRFLYVSLAFVCLAESRFAQNIFNGTQGTDFRASKDLDAKEKRLERWFRSGFLASHQGEGSVIRKYMCLRKRHMKERLLVAEHCFICWRWVGAYKITRRHVSQYVCGWFFSLLHIAATLGSNSIHLQRMEDSFRTSLHHRSITPFAEFYSSPLPDRSRLSNRSCVDPFIMAALTGEQQFALESGLALLDQDQADRVIALVGGAAWTDEKCHRRQHWLV